jgi:hypothetical protein
MSQLETLGHKLAAMRVQNAKDYESGICLPCRHHEHLLCDGGDCRCMCALELDVPMIRKKV